MPAAPPRLPTLSELYPPPYTSQNRVLQPVLDAGGVLYRDVGASTSALRAAAEARASADRELVLITSNMNQLDIAANLVANLASVGAHQYLLFGNGQQTCDLVRGRLACVWSSLLEPRFSRKLREANTNMVRTQWLVRQIYVGRLIALGFSPMVLDADVVLFANPFPLIARHLPEYKAIFLGDTSAGWMNSNGGTLFVRGASPTGPTAKVWSEFERRVLALLNTSKPYPKQEWHMTKHGRVGGVASDSLLYDQNVLDWTFLGQLTGDEEYIGRGFVKTTRVLNDSEKELIKPSVYMAKGSAPAELGTPGHVYNPEYQLREYKLGQRRADGLVEKVLVAPPWLFSAESDSYPMPNHRRHERVTARYWSLSPPPTCLAHFVCTRWPGSDGRKIGMRLLRKWFAADVAWAISGAAADGAPPQPAGGAISRLLGHAPTAQAPGVAASLKDERLIGFAAPVPLGDAHRSPAARCKAAPARPAGADGALPCDRRWRGNRASMEMETKVINGWSTLLSLLGSVSSRTVVLPLFECAGLLAPHTRYGWTLYASGAAAAPPAGLLGRPKKPRDPPAACAYRVGEGCFSKLGYPEQLAATPQSQRATVRLTAAMLRRGGVPALMAHLLNASAAIERLRLPEWSDALAKLKTAAGGRPPKLHGAELRAAPRALLVDVSDLASEVAEDELLERLSAFLASARRANHWPPAGLFPPAGPHGRRLGGKGGGKGGGRGGGKGGVGKVIFGKGRGARMLLGPGPGPLGMQQRRRSPAGSAVDAALLSHACKLSIAGRMPYVC